MTPRFGLAWWACLLLFGLFPIVTMSAPPRDTSVQNKAQTVLRTYCYRCHGQDGVAKGRFGYVLDRDKLVARRHIVPGDAKASQLYQRIHKGEMPPSGKKPRPTKSDVIAVQQWIDAGAPAFEVVKSRPFVTDEMVLRWIHADLQTIPARHRRFARYVTLVHLANAGVRETDLQIHRSALGKLVNSLSWHPRITLPQPIDKHRLVFRIDLRHYQWSAAMWDRLVTAYPYRLPRETIPAALRKATTSDLPYVRGDWFVATASRPPLYHDFLELPTTARGLERLLRVDVVKNLQEETAIRAGFNNSGVSQNNRLIERHDASYGVYWKSYDFSKNTDRQNLFQHPLGPSTGATSFAHAGGESIFELPNGLHGYFLSDALGCRIDKGPIDIVSDPRRLDRRVVTGLSCMSCHARGFLPKADQIRAHVEKNRQAFTSDTVDAVRALYLPEAKARKLLDDDTRRYQKALGKIGVTPKEAEPINRVTERYEATLDLVTAASELGMSADEFLQRVQAAPTLARNFGALKKKTGSVQRQVFEEDFDVLAEAFGLDRRATISLETTAAAVTNAFVGHTGAVLSLAFSRDGRRAVSGSADRTIRIWDVATGREVHCFKGHGDEVTSVVFTSDGKHVLSGSRDRSVRLWDSATGKVIHRLIGHTDTIRSVAVSPDGRLGLSAGDDRALRLWDLQRGEEVRAWSGHTRSIRRVVFSPDSRQALSAGLDGAIRLWKIANGRQVRVFERHTGAVYDVAFSPDGRRLLSGGNDRCVRVWDVKTGRERLCLKGHANAVIGVMFSARGRRAFSGSSQYQTAAPILRMWDVKTGRSLRSQASGATITVGCVAFVPDGRRALTGGSDGTMRLWLWSE